MDSPMIAKLASNSIIYQQLYKTTENVGTNLEFKAAMIGEIIWVSSRPLYNVIYTANNVATLRQLVFYDIAISYYRHHKDTTSATSPEAYIRCSEKKIDWHLSSWPWPYPWLVFQQILSYYCLLTRHNWPQNHSANTKSDQNAITRKIQ